MQNIYHEQKQSTIGNYKEQSTIYPILHVSTSNGFQWHTSAAKHTQFKFMCSQKVQYLMLVKISGSVQGGKAEGNTLFQNTTPCIYSTLCFYISFHVLSTDFSCFYLYLHFTMLHTSLHLFRCYSI